MGEISLFEVLSLFALSLLHSYPFSTGEQMKMVSAESYLEPSGNAFARNNSDAPTDHQSTPVLVMCYMEPCTQDAFAHVIPTDPSDNEHQPHIDGQFFEITHEEGMTPLYVQSFGGNTEKFVAKVQRTRREEPATIKVDHEILTYNGRAYYRQKEPTQLGSHLLPRLAP